MGKKSQALSSGTPKYPGLERRVMEALDAKTQHEVAEKLGLSDSSVTGWKREGFISIDTLLTISELSDASIHWLITAKGPSRIHPDMRYENEEFIPVYLEAHLEEKVRTLADKEGRNLSAQAAELIIESLVARGEVTDKVEGVQLLFLGGYNPKLITIPLLGQIAAGSPIQVFEESETIDVAEDFIQKGKRAFALRVRGDSMTEEGIWDGDIIICMEATRANPGDLVVALIDGEEATVKKFYRREGKAVLRPANPLYKDLIVDLARIVIRGIVVGIQRRP